MDLSDFFSQANADYIEQLYRQFKEDPKSVDDRWGVFFAGFEAGGGGVGSVLESLLPSRSGSPAEGIFHLVHSYRELGHLMARTNPLEDSVPEHPLLQMSEFGFTSNEDLGRPVVTGGYRGPVDGTLGGLIESLRTTYCGTMGVEFTFIPDKAQRVWLEQRMEPNQNRPELTTERKKEILRRLAQAEGFEQFLHTKYVGQKRFSVQGAETIIPLLDTLITESSELGVQEMLMGMAHRGRLNVLAHVLEKPYQLILREFEGTAHTPEDGGDGDVKYHLGYATDRELPDGRKMYTVLSPNPSHLELVNPVVEGMARARQVALGDTEHLKVGTILIHGEAAFTGQGIVPETLSLSELPYYRTGGTIHVILNNQVGFTANPEQTRFTKYPTDVARMIQAPVFHVNAEDPEAVVHAATLAAAFRQEFRVDVMIDLCGYRKYGHNETDDPSFTQPLMYKKIEQKSSTRDLYAARLIAEGTIIESDFDAIKAKVKADLDEAFVAAREQRAPERPSPFRGLWEGLSKSRGLSWDVKTSINLDVIRGLSDSLTSVPESFHPHPKLVKLLQTRQEMAAGKRGADWGCAESWALGSLLTEGTPIRITGQDTERGTFSHRHAVLHDFENGQKYTPLANLSPAQAKLTIVNTMLSELAVLGFEYGFSATDPRHLVVWEAQFGDFVNGAQAIIDQFLVSAETKWERMSGLVLLLPHGYEGQGPEHSSARLERFLQLCAEDNLQVCYPTTPAQYFHLLRRQIHRKFRKPLVLMMPKSMLRDERSSSKLNEFTETSFVNILDDDTVKATAVTRVIFCTGKVFYNLTAAREQREDARAAAALVRVEQLFPFPEANLNDVVKRYPGAREYVWVQEEPQNMGAWSFIHRRIDAILPDGKRLIYRGRRAAASPANGSFKVHQAEEQQFLKEAFDNLESYGKKG